MFRRIFQTDSKYAYVFPTMRSFIKQAYKLHFGWFVESCTCNQSSRYVRGWEERGDWRGGGGSSSKLLKRHVVSFRRSGAE